MRAKLPDTVACPKCGYEIVVPTGGKYETGYCPRCGADVPDLAEHVAPKPEPKPEPEPPAIQAVPAPEVPVEGA